MTTNRLLSANDRGIAMFAKQASSFSLLRWARLVLRDAAEPRGENLCSGAHELGETLGPRLRNAFGRILDAARDLRVPTLDDYRRTIPEARNPR